MRKSWITQAGKGAGTYYVKVSGSSSTVSNPEYSLTIVGIPELKKDQAEGTSNNNTSGTAYDLRNLAEIADNINTRMGPIQNALAAISNTLNGGNSGLLRWALGGGSSPIGNEIFNSLQNGFVPSPNSWRSQSLNSWGYSDLAQQPVNTWNVTSQAWKDPFPVHIQQGINWGANAAANISFGGGYSDLDRINSYLNPSQWSWSNSLGGISSVADWGGSLLDSVSSGISAILNGVPEVLGLGNSGYSPSYSPFTTGNWWGGGGYGYGSYFASSQNLAVISNLSIQANDQDWFKFTLDKDGEAGQFVAINFDNDLGDLKLELFEPSNTTTPVEIANGTGDSEEISLAGLAKGTYYVKVSGATTAITNPDYSLLVNAPPPLETDWIDTQNTSSTAYDLKTVDGNLLLSDLSIHNGDTDTFKFTTKGAGKDGHTVRIDFSDSQGDLDLILKDQNGNQLFYSDGKPRTSTTTADFEEISLDGLAQGTYQIQIVGYNGATNPRYSLSIVAPETIKPDGLEPNNNIANATDLSQVSGFKTLGGTIHSTTDQDYFKFTTTGIGTTGNSLSIQFEGAQGNLDLALFNQSGTAISGYTPTVTTNNETVSLKNLPIGTYYAKVSGNNGATNNYQLYLDAPTNNTVTQNINDWTILVYMTGSDLSEYAFKSINEMEIATSQFPGSVNFAILWDQSSLGKTYATGANPKWGTTGRAIIQADTNENTIATTFDTSIGELNTGSSTSLSNFINWAKTAAPANHYGLVLWDHGNGDLGGFNLDNEGNRNNTTADKLYTNELTSALQTSGINLDLFAFDACLMGITEVSYALDPYTKYFVASQEVETAGGYDYTTAFSTLYSNPDQVTAADLASGIVSSYQAKYQGDRRGWDTLSATDTSKLANFTTKLKAFTNAAIAITNTATWNALHAARDTATSFFGQSELRDLGQFLQEIKDSTNSALASLKTPASQAYDALQTAITARSSDKRDTQGLSIYFPNSSLPLDSGYITRNQTFLTNTGWQAFLNKFRTLGSSSGSISPDWAEANDVSARAYNLHSLVGNGHQFAGLSLHNPSDKDWYRFETLGTGQTANKVSVSNGLSLTLYRLAKNAQGQITRQKINATPQATVSLASAVKGEYLVEIVGNSATLPAYSLSINAPGTVNNGNDWANGNNSRIKAQDLGTITAESWVGGLRIAPSSQDWFTFETPKNQIVDPGTVYIKVTGNQIATVELYEDNGTTNGKFLNSQTGTGILQVHYSDIAGQKYWLKVGQSSTAAPASYALNFGLYDTNIIGGSQSDILTGGSKADSITGGAGNDTGSCVLNVLN